LYNETDDSFALINSVNVTGGAGYDGEITVTDAADIASWQAADVITTRSQTNVQAFGSGFFYEAEITGTELHPLATGIQVDMNYRDTSVAGTSLQIHPYQSFSSGKSHTCVIQVANINNNIFPVIPLYNQRFTFAWDASGAATGRVILIATAQIIAAP